MVEYTEFMSIAMDKCGSDGRGTGDENQRVFREFASLWSDEKDEIKQMSESEVREAIVCP